MMTSVAHPHRTCLVTRIAALVLPLVFPAVMSAQQRLEPGAWALQGGGTTRAVLHLGDTGPELLERDSSGVHTYPLRVSRTTDGMVLVVARPAGPDTLSVQPYGRRTLFVERRSGKTTGRRRIFARLPEAALARYEADLRNGPATRR